MSGTRLLMYSTKVLPIPLRRCPGDTNRRIRQFQSRNSQTALILDGNEKGQKVFHASWSLGIPELFTQLMKGGIICQAF
jgi:hypothetical protein